MEQTILQETEYAYISMYLSSGQAKRLAVDALSPKQTEDLVHEGGVIDGDGEVDVARMAGTGLLAEITCCAASELGRKSAKFIIGGWVAEMAR